MLNLFYEEPDPDRWLPFDRLPRRWIRRLFRGAPQIGGQRRVFVNLCAGLDRLGIPYRVNDYSYASRHPDELACVIGKPFVLDAHRWKNPILFGASVFSHPIEDPDLLKRLPVREVLVPGEWSRKMFEPWYGSRVSAWPVGIDTGNWSPDVRAKKDFDILLYDKVRWEHESFESSLIGPIRTKLAESGLRTTEIRYGSYRDEDFHALLQRTRGMIFLCEHETQGLAYQQALSMGVPILAWDRGGEWRDPTYHPHRVRFGEVSSVPYWDDRCGLKFAAIEDFPDAFEKFWSAVVENRFDPRAYVLENLTLEICARAYVAIHDRVAAGG